MRVFQPLMQNKTQIYFFDLKIDTNLFIMYSRVIVHILHRYLLHAAVCLRHRASMRFVNVVVVEV